MANNNWAPQAVAVKQKITITVGGTLAGETFQLGLGGQVFAEHTDADTNIATTVAALVAAWEASTHPWAAAVAAVDASPNITLEAKVAGVPFGDYLTDDETDDPAGQTWETGVRGYYEIDLNTPGGDATLAQDETTANRGPNCANLAVNWSAGTYLADDEDVTIADDGVDILWGLDYGSDDDNWVTLHSLDIRRSYTGKIGLDYATFNGNTAAPEYRGTYLKIMVDKTEGCATIGKHDGPGTPLGSRRIKLDLHNVSACLRMYGSNSQPFETGKPAVRVLCDHASTTIAIKAAPGGFGLAVDQPGETSQASIVAIHCASTKDRIYIGKGVQLTSLTNPFQQKGGYCHLQHIPYVDPDDELEVVLFDDGELVTEGMFRIATLNQEGGLLSPDHRDGTAAIEIANFNGGVCDATRSDYIRRWTTVNQKLGIHNLLLHGESVDIGTFNLIPPGGQVGI